MSRERGVLFQPDMVRAVLRSENPKRQTRRLHRLGEVGDVLWGREAYRLLAAHNAIPPRDVPPGSFVHYEADVPSAIDLLHQGSEPLGKLRPGMFMCRWMSRIDLKLVSVEEEPLNLITEADAIAEGAEPAIVGEDLAHKRYRAGFMALWERINGAGSWHANPTVFRHVFERVK